MLHIRSVCIHKLLELLSIYFLLRDISVHRYCHIYQYAFYLFFVVDAGTFMKVRKKTIRFVMSARPSA
jgi:hypothetical protein